MFLSGLRQVADRISCIVADALAEWLTVPLSPSPFARLTWNVDLKVDVEPENMLAQGPIHAAEKMMPW